MNRRPSFAQKILTLFAGLTLALLLQPATAAVRRVSYFMEWRPQTLDPEDRVYRSYDGAVFSTRHVNDDDRKGTIGRDFGAPARNVDPSRSTAAFVIRSPYMRKAYCSLTSNWFESSCQRSSNERTLWL